MAGLGDGLGHHLLGQDVEGGDRWVEGVEAGEELAVPREGLVVVLTGALGVGGLEQLRANLQQLSALVQQQPYLVGSALSLADLAVAAQLSLLLFPASAGAPLAARGVPGLADDPQLAPLWAWRDGIGAQVGRP